jgi:competence protein ComEA
MKDLLKIAFGLICALLACGLILLVARRPSGEPVILVPPPSPAPLVVHVSGAVARPGYTLCPQAAEPRTPSGGRRLSGEADEVAQPGCRAGGWHPARCCQAANAVANGWSGRLPDHRLSPFYPGSPTPIGQKININTATQAELESLPLIGPVRAKLIINYRASHGPFKKIEDIMNVPEIESYIFELIKDLITI